MFNKRASLGILLLLSSNCFGADAVESATGGAAIGTGVLAISSGSDEAYRARAARAVEEGSVRTIRKETLTTFENEANAALPEYDRVKGLVNELESKKLALKRAKEGYWGPDHRVTRETSRKLWADGKERSATYHRYWQKVFTPPQGTDGTATQLAEVKIIDFTEYYDTSGGRKVEVTSSSFGLKPIAIRQVKPEDIIDIATYEQRIEQLNKLVQLPENVAAVKLFETRIAKVRAAHKILNKDYSNWASNSQVLSAAEIEDLKKSISEIDKIDQSRINTFEKAINRSRVLKYGGALLGIGGVAAQIHSIAKDRDTIESLDQSKSTSAR